MTQIEQAEDLLRSVKREVGKAWRLIAEAELLLKRAPAVAMSKKE